VVGLGVYEVGDLFDVIGYWFVVVVGYLYYGYFYWWVFLLWLCVVSCVRCLL